MTERRNAWAHSRCVARQRDLQARIDAALALIDAATATGPRYLSPDETSAVRAALVGDQPAADEPATERVPCGNPDRHCGRRGGSAHCGGCRDDEPSPLSGEALRDVEERDDAAGDLP